MIELKLTPEEIKIIGIGLEELKFKVAFPILMKIRQAHSEYINKQKEQTNGTLSDPS